MGNSLQENQPRRHLRSLESESLAFILSEVIYLNRAGTGARTVLDCLGIL